MSSASSALQVIIGTAEARCSACKGIPVHLVKSWRNVNFDKLLCPLCANEKVTQMIKNRELEDPFAATRYY